jgi:succinate-semialdehyde dehydrogenase/glutarate-semialdehyde dehydrogenase
MLQARLFFNGEWRDGDQTEPLPDKFTGEAVAEVHQPSRAQADAALEALAAAQAVTGWTPYERYQALARASELLRERAEDAARTVVADSGFTLGDARREVDRAVQTLLLCGEEAKRLAGEMVPVDGAPGIRHRLAFTVYHPLGVVAAITPFNSPLNTVLHKVGPALAAGNAVLLKPASQTPLTACLVIELLLEAGVPPELMALLHGGGRTVGQWVLESKVPAFYAFTGSTPVGEHIHAAIGLRRAQLEMGSISSTIICDDADLDRCLPLVVNAGFRKAGQVCTSVQRLYVHDAVAADVVAGLAKLLSSKKAGDPNDPDTFVGPLISPVEAQRVESWTEAAAGQGAEVVSGGHRDGAVVSPTLLAGVTPDMTVMSNEIFGPVVGGFSDLGPAIDEINGTPYGLAAGIFTKDLDRALTAAQRLRMGSVHINETSSSRVDMMPYTGVKASGLGKEGPWWAIREMSEERLITMRRT